MSDVPEAARQLLRVLPGSKVPQVAERLVNDGAYRPALAASPDLPDGAIATLIDAKLDADTAIQLYQRPLTRKLRDQAVSTEKRVNPLLNLVSFNELEAGELRSIARSGRHVRNDLLVRLLGAGCPADALADAAERSSGKAKYHWMLHANPDEVDNDAIAALVVDYETWAPRMRGAGAMMRMLFERGPEIIEAACRSNSSMVRSVVAGDYRLTETQAWHLAGIDPDTSEDIAGDGMPDRSYTLMALIANRCVPRDLVETVEVAVERALTSAGGITSSCGNTEASDRATLVDKATAESLRSLIARRLNEDEQLVERDSDGLPIISKLPENVVYRLMSSDTDKRPLDRLVALESRITLPPEGIEPKLMMTQFPPIGEIARLSDATLGSNLSRAPSWLRTRVAQRIRALVDQHPDTASDEAVWTRQMTRQRSNRVAPSTPTPTPLPLIAAHGFGTLSLTEVRTSNQPDMWANVVHHAIATLGDDPDAWQTLLALIGDFDGTVTELVSTVQSLHAT